MRSGDSQVIIRFLIPSGEEGGDLRGRQRRAIDQRDHCCVLLAPRTAPVCRISDAIIQTLSFLWSPSGRVAELAEQLTLNYRMNMRQFNG
jgi:hypothetical protein